MSKINKIILDSNFILVPIQFKIDYLDQIEGLLEGLCEFIIFEQILDELEAKKKLQEKKRKDTTFETQLSVGLSYLKRQQTNYKIHYIDKRKENTETSDEFLLRMIKEFRENYSNVYFATNDYELRVKAIQICPVFMVRQEKIISLIY